MDSRFVMLLLLLVLSAKLVVTRTSTTTAKRLVDDLFKVYDKRIKPTRFVDSSPVNVTYSMDLYQILEMNQPQQYVLLNVWIIEKWYDELLFWNSSLYENLTEIHMPYSEVWIPDTTLYNSISMKDDDMRRLLNVKLTPDKRRKATLVEMLYPALYKVSCPLNLRYFPFDDQQCTMIVSSWTHDMTGINYFVKAKEIGRANFLENEEWELMQATARRDQVLYECCPNQYSLLKLTLYLRRKPLFYIVNLVLPTCLITLISLVGFYSSSSASEVREEKVSLGLTTMLSMAILLLMVSDNMPTTSTFVPLLGYHILGMMGLIASAVLVASFIIWVQKRGADGRRLSPSKVRSAKLVSSKVGVEIPLHLSEGTQEFVTSPPARLNPPTHAARVAYLRSLHESVANGGSSTGGACFP